MRNQTFTFAGLHDNFMQLITHGPAFDFGAHDIARIREEFKALILSLTVLYAQYKAEDEAKASTIGRRKVMTAAESEENYHVLNNNEMIEFYGHTSQVEVIEVSSGSESERESEAPKNPPKNLIPQRRYNEAHECLMTHADLDELQRGSHVLIKHVCPRHEQDHWLAFVVKRGTGGRQGQFQIRWEGMKNVKSNYAWVKDDAIRRIYIR